MFICLLSVVYFIRIDGNESVHYKICAYQTNKNARNNYREQYQKYQLLIEYQVKLPQVSPDKVENQREESYGYNSCNKPLVHPLD